MANTTQFFEKEEPAIAAGFGRPSRHGLAKGERAAFTINGRFLSQKVTGVQRYAREVAAKLDGLVAEANTNARLCAPKACDESATYQALNYEASSRASGVVWEQLYLPWRRQGPLLNLCNMAPLAAPEQIVCIHDVNTFLQPDSYSAAFRLYYRIMLPLVARRAARIATVSEFSARMIERHLGVKRRDIQVLPNGHEHVWRWRPSDATIFETHHLRRPYVLLIASRAKHKNIGLVLSLAEQLNGLGIDIWVAGGSSAIFSGAPGTNEPNVKWLGYVSDDDLGALLANAMCLAFPSLTEGFGLPLVEAMALGCPIIASDRASIPEICGEAALLASPDNPGLWIAQIELLARSNVLRSELVDEGRSRVRAFSWDKTASGYHDLLREVAA